MVGHISYYALSMWWLLLSEYPTSFSAHACSVYIYSYTCSMQHRVKCTLTVANQHINNMQDMYVYVLMQYKPYGATVFNCTYTQLHGYMYIYLCTYTHAHTSCIDRYTYIFVHMHILIVHIPIWWMGFFSSQLVFA